MSDFFDTDTLFNNRFFTPGWITRDLTKNIPAANIKENAKDYSIELAAPGLAKEDFKINLENDVLSVSAEKSTEKEEQKDNYTRQEFQYNSFSRSFRLPESINPDKIDAKYENGLLKLTIPKKEEAAISNKKEIRLQ